MHITDIFILIIVILLLILFIRNHYNEVEYVKSKIDNKYYLVIKTHNSHEAADYLAHLNKDLLYLTWHMMAKYDDNIDVKRLYQNYNVNSISEGSSNTGYTSYSVNKGEKLVLCIRQTDNSFVDRNVIMYVAIHELAHIMTKEIGHTETFSRNFRFLLNEAIKIGIYEKVNYANEPQDYCGIKISNSII